MAARYIGNIPKGGKGSITARPKPKKKQPQLTKKMGQRPGDYATGGRVTKSSGGSVSARLSKSGPVAKPNYGEKL